jgi:hypothetical protein
MGRGRGRGHGRSEADADAVMDLAALPIEVLRAVLQLCGGGGGLNSGGLNSMRRVNRYMRVQATAATTRLSLESITPVNHALSLDETGLSQLSPLSLSHLGGCSDVNVGIWHWRWYDWYDWCSLRAVLQKLPCTLRGVRLACGCLDSAHIVELLGRHAPTLTHLVLTGDSKKNLHMACLLRCCPRLEHLDLRNNRWDEYDQLELAESLQQLTKLTFLDLSRMDVTYADAADAPLTVVAALAALTGLRHLALCNTMHNIGNSSRPPLKKVADFTSALSRSLAALPGLTHLDLTSVGLRKGGMPAWTNLWSGLSTLTNLTTLNLDGCGYNDDYMRPLITARLVALRNLILVAPPLT